MPGNIILIGFMGTGKSTAGKLIAKMLHMSFLDTDCVIEEKEQKNIADIFAQNDMHYFRGLEDDAVASFESHSNTVIATGGGMVLNPKNRILLRQAGMVFCLSASADCIYERIRYKDVRPLLNGNMSPEYIAMLLKQREAAYSDCDYIIDTGPESIESVCNKIIDIYRSKMAQAGS